MVLPRVADWSHRFQFRAQMFSCTVCFEALGVMVQPKLQGFFEIEFLRGENSKQTLFFQQIAESSKTIISCCRRFRVAFVQNLFGITKFQKIV